MRDAHTNDTNTTWQPPHPDQDTELRSAVTAILDAHDAIAEFLQRSDANLRWLLDQENRDN